MDSLWWTIAANKLSLFYRFKAKASAILAGLKGRFLKLRVISFAGLLVCFAATSAHAVLLNDWIFNVDGTTSEYFYGDPMPTSGTLVDGYGTLSLEITGEGSHNVIGYFDYEIDQTPNSFYNEFAEVNRTPGAGQSWEVDEPGWWFGDIVDNVLYGQLDNTNAVPEDMPEDVAFALGWEFSLLPGDVAFINFIISDVLPTEGFFLTHADPDDPNRDFAFYSYSELTIETTSDPTGPKPVPVPEPGTVLLMLVGIPIVLAKRKRLTHPSHRADKSALNKM